MLSQKIKKQKRVCHISTVHSLSDVRIFRRECYSLVEAGYEVHLIIRVEKPFAKKPFIKERVHIHPIHAAKSRISRMSFMPWVAMIKALRVRASIYHYHDPELIFIGFILRWVFGKKVVFDMRESVTRQIMTKPYLPKYSRRIISFCYMIIEKTFLNGISVVVANDKSYLEKKNSFLIRNFPRLNKKLINKALGMGERLKSPLIIYIGGVSVVRGAFIYVELARQLVLNSHEIHMMIIGPYEQDFGQLLKAKIDEQGLQDTIELSGFMEYSKAMEFTSRAVIGLSILKPTPNYTFCLSGKIIEYMMCGTPVLASDFDVWRPYVEGERTGMMADPTKIDEVVDVCERMLSNPKELAAMGKRGIEAVRSKYNWSTEAKELLKCYNDLLNK